MSVQRREWTLEGFDGLPIRGVTESPGNNAEPKFVLILAHGFIAHMDFGFLPPLRSALIQRFAAQVVRFTFSHAGITGAEGIRVDRPDLLTRDTWGKQIFDLGVVFDSIRAETPSDIPVVIAGHSRGGGVCLLLAGRRFATGQSPTPDGVIAIQAPDRPGSFSDDDCARLVREGFAPITSPATGQLLRLGPEFGQERLDDPAAFDVMTLCESIACPVLAVGGELDRLVPPVCLRRIARACPKGEAIIIDGADHMFNTPEPAVEGATPSTQVQALCEAIGVFSTKNP